MGTMSDRPQPALNHSIRCRPPFLFLEKINAGAFFGLLLPTLWYSNTAEGAPSNVPLIVLDTMPLVSM